MNEDKKYPKLPKTVVVGSKIYERCSGCRRLIRINKPLLGSLHVCN